MLSCRYSVVSFAVCDRTFWHCHALTFCIMDRVCALLFSSQYLCAVMLSCTCTRSVLSVCEMAVNITIASVDFQYAISCITSPTALMHTHSAIWHGHWLYWIVKHIVMLRINCSDNITNIVRQKNVSIMYGSCFVDNVIRCSDRVHSISFFVVPPAYL